MLLPGIRALDNGCTRLTAALLLSALRIERFPFWARRRLSRLDRRLTKTLNCVRLLGTFKRTIFGLVWFIQSVAQLDRFCEDFRAFYNHDRPHSAWGGRTPDEVWFGRKRRVAPVERVAYFDGLMPWYRFG